MQHFDVPGVFMFVAGAMAVVVLSIAVFGPRTNSLSLADISKLVPERG